MKMSKIILFNLVLTLLFISFSTSQARASPAKSKPMMIFKEYLGAQFNGITFSDVPISPNVDEFHFILSFAIDYKTGTSSRGPVPTNGDFKVYWDTENLSPSHISSIKSQHRNVKVAMSLGGDTLEDQFVFFSPESINSWVENAVQSITEISKEFDLDGIDIDYEHFNADPDTFAECIGRLVFNLKQQKVVSYVSIAPFDEESVQAHYMALWKKYGDLIDYVNFQFYAYDKGTTVSQFLKFFDEQSSNYEGSNMLVSFGTDEKSGGLSPENGFFEACNKLKSQGKLQGIFIWSADDSMKDEFQFEKKSQNLLLA
ncbi:hypothetical protein EZV62_002535 [Acer yangbiense]|uniref:GH18 domain-containing protein n=1 Tax=Acer yangbiense TaxID=1000413 RepID=A0A5C7IZY0_9ROSI|nr:hypothetical protein EZV62_002535 [Acer yangbiense]